MAVGMIYRPEHAENIVASGDVDWWHWRACCTIRIGSRRAAGELNAEIPIRPNTSVVTSHVGIDLRKRTSNTEDAATRFQAKLCLLPYPSAPKVASRQHTLTRSKETMGG